MSVRLLTSKDFENAAKIIGCEVAAICAVAEVESAGNGFLKSGKPKILFEGHWFHQFTKGVYDSAYPNISYPKWTRKHYLGGEKEYDRYTMAEELDKRSAMMSTSWGKFQIMGFNFAKCGCKTVHEFVYLIKQGEHEHLKLFCNFILNNSLDDELCDKRWADFAYRYNGPSYKKNQYDVKIQKAYDRWVKSLKNQS